MFQSTLGFSNASAFSAHSAVKFGGIVISLENSTVPGLQVFNVPELLLVCKKRELINKAEVKQIIEMMRKKDRYLLKKEVEEELLK